MKLLPYDCWTVKSPVATPELVMGMRKRIEPTKWFRAFWNTEHATLQGRIDDHGFSVSRIIHYRNSWLPMLYGTFTPHNCGTTIRVRMLLHPLVMLFMGSWLGVTGLFAAIGILAGITEQNWAVGAGAGGMFCVGLIMAYACFWAEAGRTKAALANILRQIQEELANKAKDATSR